MTNVDEHAKQEADTVAMEELLTSLGLEVSRAENAVTIRCPKEGWDFKGTQAEAKCFAVGISLGRATGLQQLLDRQEAERERLLLVGQRLEEHLNQLRDARA